MAVGVELAAVEVVVIDVALGILDVRLFRVPLGVITTLLFELCGFCANYFTGLFT